MKKILIFGSTGQVGFELKRLLLASNQLILPMRSEADLSAPDRIAETIRTSKPDIIINAAAYTAVDKAESEKELAYAVNTLAPAIMAEEAKKIDALLVHYSTDYVFNGQATVPYREEDKTDPLNVYGVTKLGGENAIQAVSGRHLILRTSWVYSMRGKNFLLTMLRLSSEKKPLRIVGDQFGAPTWARSIAEATGNILSSPNLLDHLGLYHLTCAGETSWHRFAEAIMKRSHVSPCPEVMKISTSEYPLPAKRPLYSMLDNGKIKANYGIVMPDWKDALQQCLEGYFFT